MRTCIMAFLILVFHYPSSSQDSSAIQKLQLQFVDLYNFNKKDSTLNYFTLMIIASSIFNIENKIFNQAVKDLIKQSKNLSVDSAASKIFDSVFSYFSKFHLWSDHLDKLEKNRVFFELYNQKICSCVSPKLERNDEAETLKNVLNSCMLLLMG